MVPLGIMLVLMDFASPAHAQLLPNDTTGAPQENARPEWPEDSLGRRTPRGTVYGFIRAVADQDYTRAAHYLDIDTTLQDNVEGAGLAQTLQRLLDQQGEIIPYSWISDDPQGLLNDNLRPELDRVGSATVDGERFDILVERTEGPAGAPVWLFSSQTVRRIPASIGAAAITPLDRVLPAYLKENRWSGVPVGHWLAMIVLAIVAYLVAWIFTVVAIFAIRLLWTKTKDEAVLEMLKAFAQPLRIYLAVIMLVAASQMIGVSIIARQRFSELAVIIGLVAVLLLLWRLVDVIAGFSKKSLTRRGNLGAFSAVVFLQRATKIALIIFGIIAILGSLGFDVTTGLAALGIGGIALALGAQKTVENFVGSVTLIADQPVRVGDFCKIGDTVGTVERIGMRSTRIRTLARTIVTIPNGEFSSLRIENYAHRDRFLFNHTLGMRFETTPDQMRFLLVEIRAMLYAHPKVDPEPARLRFREFGADSLNLEVFAYVHASNFEEFLEVQEDLFLRIMDIVEASGTGFAFPSQTLYMARDKGVSAEKTQEAEREVQKWREAGEMQLPRFDEARINRLRSEITYPPEGSSWHTSKRL
ncbi:hypothetical protein GCM10027443_32380 [Pontibacter brevis]